MSAPSTALPSPPPALGSVAGAPWGSRVRMVAALLAVVAVLPACTAAERSQEQATNLSEVSDSTALATPPAMQPDDLVDLTIYLRSGQGAEAHLEPVVREVPVTDDLPRRALELLLEGPTEADGVLEPPLPTSTRVLDLDVEGGTARVNLSADVLRDADSIGSTPVHEVLALGALANTLTEFPSIEQVELAVDGEQNGAVETFWGSWGLPEILVRDESLVGESEGSAVADIVRFSDEVQEAGASDAPPVRVANIRVRDRLTHTSFVVELEDANGDDVAAKVPPVRVRRSNDDITLLLSEVADLGMDGSTDVVEGGALTVDPEQFSAARTEHDERAGQVRIVLTPTSERPYWLHTLTNPPRIILDVKK